MACAADTSVGSECKSSGETGWDVRKEIAASDACTATGELIDAPVVGDDTTVDLPGTIDNDEPQEPNGDATPAGQSPAPSSRGESSCALARAPLGRSAWLSPSLAMMLAATLAARRARFALKSETRRP